MKYKWLFVGMLAIGAVCLSGFNRDDDSLLEKIATRLDKWLTEHPQEKVHLHLDKPYYAIGDDIWFKAYVTVGAEHRLSALSGILNVELIDDNETIKQSIKIPLVSGLGWGDFALADTLKEGNYRIRAYTNWMRNAGPDYFFDKTITIVNAVSNKVFTKTNYTYTTQNGRQQVNAYITYTDLDSVPYAGKEVSYQVISNTRVISKGKGVTNNQGSLDVSFINNMPALFQSGRLVTVIKLSDDEKITKSIPVKTVSENVDVQFFPESGYLVNGITSKVAFKATGADGLGKDVSGNVIDAQGNVVASLGSTHLGMGVFSLMPRAGKQYSARVTFADGSEKVLALPTARNSGYVLSVDVSNPDIIGLRIFTNDTTSGQVNLVAQANGKLLYAAKTRTESSAFTAVIPASRFPSGIVQFTLFAANGQPLNERLVFIQKNDLLKPTITTEKQVYAPREKVILDITAKNGMDSLVEGSFSVAVTDETRVAVNEDEENTILTDILLTSDLRGYVEKPNYYFTNVNSKTRANLDILMLTQGYRRFEWKQLLNDNLLTPVYKPERTLSVSGTVTLKDKPLAGARVVMFNTTGNVFTADTVTDEQGRFTFNNLLFADSARLIFQASKPNIKKSKLDITLDDIAPQQVTQNKNLPNARVNLNEGLIVYLQSSKQLYNEQLNAGLGSRTIVLQEVVIKEKRQEAKNSSNLNGAGNADQVLTAKDLSMGCVTLEMCLQGRLTGVIFMSGVPYSTRNMARGIPMQLIVDGAYVGSDYLRILNINDVETIEVLRTVGKTAIYGSLGNGGVIIITTKRGEINYNYNTLSPGITSYSPQGYYLAREFYSPQYDDPTINTQLADLRTTIYWNPNLLTDKDGKTQIEYFNAGRKGTYRVVVEGIDNDGHIGRTVYRYKVE